MATKVATALRWITALRRGPSPLPLPRHGIFEKPPVIGFRLSDAVAKGTVHIRPDISRLTPEGALFVDGQEAAFDEIILATGFKPALQMFPGTLQLDERGTARRDRVKSLDWPGLYFVGQNFGSIGALKNIASDAPLVAKMIADEVAQN